MRALVRTEPAQPGMEGSPFPCPSRSSAAEERQKVESANGRSLPRASCGVAIAEALCAVGGEDDRRKAGADFPRASQSQSSVQRSPNSCILGELYDGVGCAVQNLREKTDTITPTHHRRTEYVVGRGPWERFAKFGREAQNRIQSPTLDQESAVKANITPVGRYFFSINPVSGMVSKSSIEQVKDVCVDLQARHPPQLVWRALR
ncbi:hypothetical protein EDB89DRAFT_473572 [Lactarius sanguifluus]|nr:hypothetical protein EDB89DRAFT_473572 [Lactarius sanguifluus]